MSQDDSDSSWEPPERQGHSSDKGTSTLIPVVLNQQDFSQLFMTVQLLVECNLFSESDEESAESDDAADDCKVAQIPAPSTGKSLQSFGNNVQSQSLKHVEGLHYTEVSGGVWYTFQHTTTSLVFLPLENILL